MPDLFTAPQEIHKKPHHEILQPANKTIVTALKTHDPSHLHAFASFCQNPPKHMHFQNQEPDEQILLFLRRHFITNVPWILITILLIILPSLFVVFSNAFFSTFSIPPSFVTILGLFYYALVLTYAFLNFIDWFYNISLITNTRIVDIDFSNLIYHDVAITKLTLVEDVNYTKIGFIRSLFNFGDVFVQTAGEKDHFDFLAIPNPQKVISIIANLIGE